MPKTLAGHEFTPDETKELLTKGEIFNMDGFVSKAGKPFSAGLYFKKDGTEIQALSTENKREGYIGFFVEDDSRLNSILEIANKKIRLRRD